MPWIYTLLIKFHSSHFIKTAGNADSWRDVVFCAKSMIHGVCKIFHARTQGSRVTGVLTPDFNTDMYGTISQNRI